MCHTTTNTKRIHAHPNFFVETPRYINNATPGLNKFFKKTPFFNKK